MGMVVLSSLSLLLQLAHTFPKSPTNMTVVGKLFLLLLKHLPTMLAFTSVALQLFQPWNRPHAFVGVDRWRRARPSLKILKTCGHNLYLETSYSSDPGSQTE